MRICHLCGKDQDVPESMVTTTVMVRVSLERNIRPASGGRNAAFCFGRVLLMSGQKVAE
jgi:hypothetical protein